ncbi:MAG: polysaccharide biosynthesis/export family protein, partial [Planctomycetota bacterium]|nr:polysaccharide biosynthesis/export family protein [Planctomycetota bacterium]
RNNDFGEFDDSLYAGLDAQPSLPGLPGGQDIMPMMGGPSSYPVPAALAPEYRFESKPSNRAISSSPVSLPGAAGAAAAAASGQAGITAGSHFYPIEQLVFGGDYPDIDKPELYRLMPRDVVTVTVKDHPEFSGTLDIQADGTVRIANTPDLIRLRGLAVDEAAEEIRRTLQVYVKGECVVRVQANRARGGYYFVFGDVNQPGRFPMGLEPVRLSDAILAANWEANPNRMEQDDELGPAFPAAGPRGKFIAPRSADMARVMLITPHRSQPVRTLHDVRSAMLGMTGNDPAVRPGQIIVVPSLDPHKNRSLGLEMPDRTVPPDGLMPGGGFSGADSPARLPEVSPDSHPYRARATVHVPAVEANMTRAFGVQSTTAPSLPPDKYAAPTPPVAVPEPETFEETRSMAGPAARGKNRSLPRGNVGGIRNERKSAKESLKGWNKGL